MPRAGPLSAGSSPKQLPISESGPRHWYLLNFWRCPSWSVGPRAPGFRGAGVPIFLSASALASRLWHASMPQSPAARWEIQNAEAIVMRMLASYRSIESPCGRYCHLLVVTSCLLMEVTQPFQIVCRTHWPSPRGHQLLPPRNDHGIEPLETTMASQGLKDTGLGPLLENRKVIGSCLYLIFFFFF